MKKEYEGQTPRAPRHLGFVHYLDAVTRRAAAIKPAALRTCPKSEWTHDADSNGVWGPRPQETFILQVFDNFPHPLTVTSARFENRFVDERLDRVGGHIRKAGTRIGQVFLKHAPPRL